MITFEFSHRVPVFNDDIFVVGGDGDAIAGGGAEDIAGPTTFVFGFSFVGN